MNKTRNKLILIFLLTAATILLLLLLPESLIDEIALPVLLGTMYPSAAGAPPNTSIDKVLHAIILLTPAVGYAVIISLSSAFAYIIGVGIHYLFKKMITESEYF